MSVAVLLYQIVIASIIIGAGISNGKAACFWAAIAASVWTLTHVFMPWLMILQFVTILIALLIGLSVANAKTQGVEAKLSAYEITDLRSREVTQLWKERLERERSTSDKLGLLKLVIWVFAVLFIYVVVAFTI